MKKSDSRDLLSIAELILLIILLLCYGGTLCFLILGYRTQTILFFVLHSIVSVVFLLVSHDRMARASLKQSEQTAGQYEEKLQQLSRYSEELSLIRKEKEALLSEKERLDNEHHILQQEAASLRASLTQQQETSEQTKLPNHLLPPEKPPVELNIIAAVRAVMDEMSPFSRSAGIQLLLSSANEVLMVRADAAYIRILFRNIIDNSIKYMNRNGTLVITVSPIGDDLFIVLKDNGEGLPSAETNHIFELNYQGSNRVSGNGLGLTQAKAIVEYYGGTIYAKSNSGNGMGIYIQLPACSR